MIKIIESMVDDHRALISSCNNIIVRLLLNMQDVCMLSSVWSKEVSGFHF